MNKTRMLIAAGMLISASAAHAASAITYTLSLPTDGVIFVSGSITTDGATPTIGMADITSYDIVVTAPNLAGYPLELTPSNSSISVGSIGASPTALSAIGMVTVVDVASTTTCTVNGVVAPCVTLTLQGVMSGLSVGATASTPNGASDRESVFSQSQLIATVPVPNAPTVSATVSGLVGTDDWFISPAMITWTVTGTPTPTTSGCNPISGSDPGATYTCSATNSLGGAMSTVVIKQDTVPPTVVVSQPSQGAQYHFKSKVSAVYACTDAGSGVASCTGTVASGQRIDTLTTGTKHFTVTGTDNAGNKSTQVVTYSVDK